ncbi:hypothetical protein [Pseudoalteromonas ardens]|uniref:hypothetical protein n=1 Tax=Pseudoalteromonas ardens TaxID=3048490 RepID=UPI0012E0E7B3|nr:hypothetical protein [Pseudoalteromonas sp. R96]MDK1310918.1 hypothetical protein [Pseudoalteromonas sp. R96]
MRQQHRSDNSVFSILSYAGLSLALLLLLFVIPRETPIQVVPVIQGKAINHCHYRCAHDRAIKVQLLASGHIYFRYEKISYPLAESESRKLGELIDKLRFEDSTQSVWLYISPDASVEDVITASNLFRQHSVNRIVIGKLETGE